MSQPPTRNEVIYFGIEVKPDSGASSFEAVIQLLTWTSALHAANHVLIERALFKRTQGRAPEDKIKITAMPTVGCVVVGHNWSFYLALRTPAERTLEYTGDDIKVVRSSRQPNKGVN